MHDLYAMMLLSAGQSETAVINTTLYSLQLCELNLCIAYVYC